LVGVMKLGLEPMLRREPRLSVSKIDKIGASA